VPALARGKAKSQTAVCASNMKSWAYATQLYVGDNDDCLPFFGEVGHDYTKPFWHAKLAPYLARRVETDVIFDKTEVFHDAIRKCPGGRKGPPPFADPATKFTDWNCWVGANFGTYGKPLSGMFYYGNLGPPMRTSCIRRPADALMFMDTVRHYVYSPVDSLHRFVVDMDLDGTPDTSLTDPEMPFNSGRPTVHSNGANVTLLDGHVERVPFRELWKIDGARRVTHPFWYLGD
jgi:prepilin-type processing-associated H-X9-DG protein